MGKKRREIKIVSFNLPEHNFILGLTNKSADENDVKEISRLLGQEFLKLMTLFRLVKSSRQNKTVLDSIRLQN